MSAPPYHNGNGNGNTNNTGGSQNRSGILFPESGKVSSIEQELIDLIRTGGKEKNYELIEYVNDVNRQYAEVLMELNENGYLDTAYSYGNERLSADRFEGSSYYYLYEGRGSVSAVTGTDGYLTASYRYNAYGEMTFGHPQYENVYGYNGESYNPNLNGQYLRARYYHVETANFFTEDSYLGNIREPLSLNRYNYVYSSYLNYIDPSGHKAILQILKDRLNGINNFASETIKSLSRNFTSLSRNQTVYLTDLMEKAVRNASYDKCSDTISITGKYAKDIESLFQGFYVGAAQSAAKTPDEIMEFYLNDKYVSLAEFDEAMEYTTHNIKAYRIGKVVGDIGVVVGGIYLGITGSAETFTGAGLTFGGVATSETGIGVGIAVAGTAITAKGIITTTVGANMALNGISYAIKDIEKLREKKSANDTDRPSKIEYDTKQLGKKYGEHRQDYPDLGGYKDYKDLADKIFENPDKIIFDKSKGEYYFIKDKNLLRINENGDFISLYPGADSARVLEAIENGGLIWP